MEPKYGWLDALAEATHQPYYPNNTGGGPSIKVRFIDSFFYVIIIKFLFGTFFVLMGCADIEGMKINSMAVLLNFS
jgi:hypothetical protein